MSPTASLATGRPIHMRDSGDARCPHVVFEQVFGPRRVAELMEHVGARRDEFRPGIVRNRVSGRRGVNAKLRSCLHLRDLGVHEGETVRCRACTASQLLLETPAGRVVALARDWARFIQIAPASVGPATRF